MIIDYFENAGPLQLKYLDFIGFKIISQFFKNIRGVKDFSHFRDNQIRQLFVFKYYSKMGSC